MATRTDSGETRSSVTLHLQYTRGRHGAGARLEVVERPAGRVGLLALRGWVDLSAARGIERTLEDLAARGVTRLIVDGSQLLHIDYRLVPRLADALVEFERRAGSVGLCGLSRYLRDLFRIAGCESRLTWWPSAGELLDARPAAGPELRTDAPRERERAS